MPSFKLLSAALEVNNTEKNLKLCNLNENECKRLAEQMVATAAMGNKRFYEQKLYENESQWQNLKKSLAYRLDGSELPVVLVDFNK